MLKLIFAIALLGITFSFIDKHILNPKPAVRKITRYENYSIDDDGTINYHKKIDTYV